MFPWHTQLVTLSALLPLGAGLVKYRIANRPMMLLTGLLAYIALSDLISIWLASRSIGTLCVPYGNCGHVPDPGIPVFPMDWQEAKVTQSVVNSNFYCSGRGPSSDGT